MNYNRVLNDGFHKFLNYISQTNWAVITGQGLITYLNISVSLVALHSCGTLPPANDTEKSTQELKHLLFSIFHCSLIKFIPFNADRVS